MNPILPQVSPINSLSNIDKIYKSSNCIAQASQDFPLLPVPAFAKTDKILRHLIDLGVCDKAGVPNPATEIHEFPIILPSRKEGPTELYSRLFSFLTELRTFVSGDLPGVKNKAEFPKIQLNFDLNTLFL